ncbi:MAG: hypothetical protein DRI61_16160 [Chloroflexi bacterium]|nr:MAG: hypothetical protein DRI61_16160 [Chloroflexota bacterium]
MFHYVSYMDEETGRKWVELTLKALDAEQSQFQRDKETFKHVDIDLFGETLIASAITSSPTFVRTARSVVKAHLKGEEEGVPQRIKETITSEKDLWIIIQVDPEKKHFQISAGGGGQITQQAMFKELIKALRAEVLKKRGRPIPKWEELSEGGSIQGTEYLWLNDKDAPQILWGSLTRPDTPPAILFGKTGSKIKENLVDITKMVIDKNYFPPECNPRSCRYCTIYPWQLRKCMVKRKKKVDN